MIEPAKNNSVCHVLVVGAGGNIGSHLVPHLGRMIELNHVTLIDRDVYEEKNIHGQDIRRSDAGRRKALVQKRRLMKINPDIRVDALTCALEDVPLGKLKCDCILSCLDTRISRQYISQAAWKLGVPLIDAGVQAQGMLVRVSVYLPGVENPCLECLWNDSDYEALEQRYSCAEQTRAASTNAPSSLGALAASIQAIELSKLLADSTRQNHANRQIVMDAAHNRYYHTMLSRNPHCRFSPYTLINLEFLKADMKRTSLKDLFISHGIDGNPFLRVEGNYFAL